MRARAGSIGSITAKPRGIRYNDCDLRVMFSFFFIYFFHPYPFFLYLEVKHNAFVLVICTKSEILSSKISTYLYSEL